MQYCGASLFPFSGLGDLGGKAAWLYLPCLWKRNYDLMMFHSFPVAKEFLLAGSDMEQEKNTFPHVTRKAAKKSVRVTKWMWARFRKWKVTSAALYSPGNHVFIKSSLPSHSHVWLRQACKSKHFGAVQMVMEGTNSQIRLCCEAAFMSARTLVCLLTAAVKALVT